MLIIDFLETPKYKTFLSVLGMTKFDFPFTPLGNNLSGLQSNTMLSVCLSVTVSHRKGERYFVGIILVWG